MASSPLARIADDLCALVPEDFTAARDAAVKKARADGDRELADDIKALRRPSVAAWLANLLVRAHPDDVDDLLSLGSELREAQDALDGAALRTMTRRRQEVVRSLSALAREAAGTSVADAAVRELEATLDSALLDEDAARALRSGRLLRSLASTGFEAVDLAGAVAAPDDLPSTPTRRVRATAKLPERAARGRTTAAKKTAAKKTAAKTTAAKKAAASKTANQDAERRQALAQAEAGLAEAAGELDARETQFADARAAVAAIDAELERLQNELDEAGARRTEAEHVRREADAARKAAARARDAAQRAVATARSRAGRSGRE